MRPVLVLKVGGNEIDDEAFLDGLAAAIDELRARVAPVLVHGGGKEIARLQAALGLEPRFVEGLRVTDEASLRVAEMVLSGLVNKRLVGRLVGAGIPAVGLSGVDGGLIRVRRLDHPSGDLGWVGEVTGADATLLRLLLDRGMVPVVSPISLGPGGRSYNVNADHAARALAVALSAASLAFVTNVRGVLVDGEVVGQLTANEAQAWIARGTIAGGMVPKVRAALEVVAAGVAEVRIVDLDGLRLGGGTRVVREGNRGNPARRRTMDTQDIIGLDRSYVLQTYKRPAFVLERGEGVYLYDSEGRRYLDFVAGIAVNALGYGDPEILAALSAQAAKLTHASNLYHTAPHALLARDLVERSFADRVFFCNSGTEANEAALKFARKWQRLNHACEERSGIVAFTGSFHGRTMGALSTTHREKYRTPFEPLVPGVRFATFNDVEAAVEAIDPTVGTVIVEPLQGEGGVNVAEPQFLQALRRACDEQEAVLIFDEVQCGLGRTGTLWAYEAAGVTPDIMTLAKPLGGGLPIGATLMTHRVAEAIVPGDHGSTFAANPVICEVARVVLRRLSEPAFLASVRQRGAYLRQGLQELRARHPVVQAVRGRGLIWGLELAVEAAPLVAKGYERGLIVTSAGDRVLRLVPPLIVNEEQIDAALAIIDELLATEE